ncbi:unnamed protein product [Prunus armeniaca]
MASLVQTKEGRKLLRYVKRESRATERYLSSTSGNGRGLLQIAWTRIALPTVGSTGNRMVAVSSCRKSPGIPEALVGNRLNRALVRSLSPK